MASPAGGGGSASLREADYWWYRARSTLLQAVMERYLFVADTILDVGSADGPSVGWLSASSRRVTLDIDARGLSPGAGVCGSALRLPIATESVDAVTAFDVLEHLEPEIMVLSEWKRVLRPGGVLLISVPAYEWAWSDHDDRAGHVRRYTERRLTAAVTQAGFAILRSTYAFASVFPAFVAERLRRRWSAPQEQPDRRLPAVSPTVEASLLALCAAEARVIRSRRIAFGSSVFLAARKPMLHSTVSPEVEAR